MMNMTFSPKLRTGNDVLEQWLLMIAQYVLVGTMLVLPILFWPHSQLSLGFTKSFVVLAGVIIALIVFSFFVLRIGTVRVVAPLVQLALWSLALFAVASALLSGDRQDALMGDTMQIQTAGFMLLIALVTSAAAFILDSKTIVLRFLLGFAVVAFVLQFWHIMRLLVGPEFLTLGVFTSATISPLGSFNDTALFAGLTVVLSIVALLQLPLRGAALWFVGVLVGMSLFLLAVVNFFIVWLVIGFFSLLVLLYSLTRDRLLAGGEAVANRATAVSRPVLGIIAAVCVSAAVFIVAGNYVGSALSNTLGVQYLEVRPSVSATLDVVRATYQNDNAFLGIGPNRFEDAWRLYKDPVINETLFWNTNFSAGSGYLLTLLVTLGIVGGILILLFLCSLMYTGYRMLVVAGERDPFWYFVGTAAFSASVYLWGIAFVYVPGTALLLLTAFFTGLCLVAFAQLVPQSLLVVNFTSDRPRAFILIALVMVGITAGVGALFVTGKQYAAHVVYAGTVQQSLTNPDPAVIDAALERAQNLYASDTFVIERARLRLFMLSALLENPEPTADDQMRFETAAVEALRLVGEAVSLDSTNPTGHALLGSVYGLLALAGVENAQEMSAGALARARELDPQNPEYALIEAQIAVRQNDLPRARERALAAVTIKRNFVDALYLLSQIDVAEGNTEAAAATARSIISIEPQNPTRYFQLGAVLLGARDLGGAAAAFEAALMLDPNFANARYLLALVYLEEERRDDALTALRLVAATNADNAELQELIATLEAGEPIRPPLGVNPPVAEPTTVVVDGEGVATSSEVPATDRIVPVNRNTGSQQPATQSGDQTASEFEDGAAEGDLPAEDVVSSE